MNTKQFLLLAAFGNSDMIANAIAHFEDEGDDGNTAPLATNAEAEIQPRN